MDQYIQTNNITLHYLDYAGPEPPIVLMHGLTINAHEFDSLVKAGLNQHHRVIAVDLRGRGLSDKPADGYSLADHAADIIGLLDGLALKQVILGGHSFGGLMSYYLAAHYPERVSKLIIMDSAASFHPRVAELLGPSIARLGQSTPSIEEYLTAMQNAPHLKGRWSPDLESFFRSDVAVQADGSVVAHTVPHMIPQLVADITTFDMETVVQQIKQQTILLNATEPYGPADYPPLLPKENALATVKLMANCRYVGVPGNHFTMVFGDNAPIMVKAIAEFL